MTTEQMQINILVQTVETCKEQLIHCRSIMNSKGIIIKTTQDVIDQCNNTLQIIKSNNRE
jgi:hypothetical protein